MKDKAEILKARAQELATPLDQRANKEQILNILEFTLGEETYGIEMQYVKQISDCMEITPIPDTPDFILGVMNLRQRIISIVDLKKILEIPGKEEQTKKSQVIVIEKQELEFALLVDYIYGDKTINTEALQEPPSTFTGIKKDLLKGLTKEKLIVLNGETFFKKKDFIINIEVENKKR